MYYILYGFLYMVSLLPMRVLYLVSDAIYGIVYYVIGYRRRLVMDNLRRAFPEKTEEELVRIAKKFYHNFIDSFMEVVKLVSASDRWLARRFTVDVSALDELYPTGKSVQMHLGHTFNWEWGQLVLTGLTKYQILVVYMPISNKPLEKLFYRLRTRNGNAFLPAPDMKEAIVPYLSFQYLLGLVADQSPGNMQNSYWIDFLGRATPFAAGPEKGARSGHLPVVFASIEKPRRGHYHATMQLACMDAAELAEGELTRKYVRYLEAVIRRRPDMWLWSHRRWKHAWKEEYESKRIDTGGMEGLVKKLIAFAFVFFGALCARGQYYLNHVNVVDVEKGIVIEDQTVGIRGHRIESIAGATAGKGLPAGDSSYSVYDCSGKYLIPGLWDMHIHDGGDDSSNRFEYVPMFLANGVTGIRDMWGSEELLKLKKDIDAGRFIGPRMIVGSPIIDGEKSMYRTTLRATTENQGMRLVDSLADAGYDFIKILSVVRAPVYMAIAYECRRRGIPLEGHLPVEVGLEQAIDAWQRSFEHNFGVDRYLTGGEAASIRWAHHYLDTVHSTRDVQYMVRIEPLGISEKDFYLPAGTLDKMIKNRVAVVPTLTLAQGRSTKGEVMAQRTKGLEYLTPDFVRFWMGQAPAFPGEFVQNFGAAARFLMNKGVLILAGTDVNNPFCVPGFGLQQELVNLHDAGLTNLQVLQTATINPAKFLYKEKEMGTVAEGKLADLVVLDDNPLVEISNTQKIYAVIVDGKYISSSEIGRMLDGLRRK
jgi:Kdo2-lipid IVA lauroyltransferase/acyltransferase